MSALVMGALAGVVCFVMVAIVKNMFGYDDALDAFGVHGVGGTLGALLTGVFADKAINSALNLDKGNAAQVMNQAIGVAIAWALAIVGTLVILKIVDVVVGVRVTRDDEVEGLDLSQHGEDGYSYES